MKILRITWTSVEFVGLRDVTATELDALADLRSDGGARVSPWCDRVQVGGTRERVACVVHDAVEVVRLAERVHLGRRQSVEVVLLTCKAPTSGDKRQLVTQKSSAVSLCWRPFALFIVALPLNDSAGKTASSGRRQEVAAGIPSPQCAKSGIVLF